MFKALFDNCVPDPLEREFRRVGITKAREEGLQEYTNSKLELEAYKRGYDALITLDTDFAKPGHIPEYHIPVALLRALPLAVVPTLSGLVPLAERVLLSGVGAGVYIWDNLEGKVAFSRSFADSEAQRDRHTEEKRKRRRG